MDKRNYREDNNEQPHNKNDEETSYDTSFDNKPQWTQETTIENWPCRAEITSTPNRNGGKMISFSVSKIFGKEGYAGKFFKLNDISTLHQLLDDIEDWTDKNRR